MFSPKRYYFRRPSEIRASSRRTTRFALWSAVGLGVLWAGTQGIPFTSPPNNEGGSSSGAPKDPQETKKEGAKAPEQNQPQPPEGGATNSECVKKGTSLECPNPGGTVNPIKVTVVKDNKDNLVFTSGEHSWTTAERGQASRTIGTVDPACEVTLSTNPVEGGKYRGRLNCERPIAQALRAYSNFEGGPPALHPRARR
jgi:hypothetical protein